MNRKEKYSEKIVSVEEAMSHIKDGDCLQPGRGKLPDYVMTLLSDKKDLG